MAESTLPEENNFKTTKLPEITLEFGKSTSQNYDLAVEYIKKNPTYTETGQGKSVKHTANYSLANINPFFELYDLVSGWKSTAIYMGGQQIPSQKICQSMYCYKQREKAFDPDEYCCGRDDAYNGNDNDFGCRHTGIDVYGWHGLNGFGEIKSDGSFAVDKNRLIHAVSTNLEPYLLCPALNPKKIEQKLKAFPDTINPKTNKSWEYVTEWENGKDIAIAVKKKEKRKGEKYVVKDENTYQINYDLTAATSSRSSPKKHAARTGCLLSILFVMCFITLLVIIF
ncbi:hypothetical protein [Candidatus Formimonas warabiya]|uniref:Uncharacterized protein n=1 Tax=Formimonas warabiya TaxID=1761012 RepID=A0A3G1KNT1_FORW1|nr:hypothetical protein [Candidatus Formimonas warabiya]ATW24122.1 hypothetical protein DCMF_04405 [Candidatus Formimonas warabiya]